MRHFIDKRRFAAVMILVITSAAYADEPATQPVGVSGTVAAKTQWFSKARYGIFVHYLNSLQNNPEHVASLARQTDWDTCVREFDVERFASRCAEAGAGYVIFTAMQQTRFLIAPNDTFDRITGYKPGEACARRDLIAELADALNKHHIPLMLYWTGDGPCADAQAVRAMGGPENGKVSEKFVRNWASVAAEYGRRYGKRVRGFWVDGCYRWLDYNESLLGLFAEGLRTGYPDRIIAFNPGVEPVVRPYSRHEDYTTGEQNTFTDTPLGRFVGGEQWHLLAFLGANWAQPGTQLGKSELVDYVAGCNAVGGVVSIDVVLYRDGDLDRSQLEVLKSLRAGIAERERNWTAWRRSEAVPPRNMAWRKPAALLSVDGLRRLIPSVGAVHAARCGIDGDPATAAIAGGDWAWMYEVNLLDAAKFSRIVIRFGGGYATSFEVLTSVDGRKWTSIDRRENQTGGVVEITGPSRDARFIAVRAIKPDGPNQPGTQMSIAEVEVYE